MIRSRDNPLVKLIRSLRLRDHRETERAFIVEGVRAVEDALAAGGAMRWLVVREGHPALPFFQGDERARILDAKLFDFVAQTETPQGVLAVFDMPRLPIPARSNPLFVVLDAISDPGNMGTIVRTSAGAGVDALFLWPGCVDPFNPKVVRAAMGAHFRVPILWRSDDVQAAITERCPGRVLSDGAANRTYDAIDWTIGSTLIIGSEAHGASPEARALANATAAITMAAGVESLNAGVAAGVMLFEAQRQRRGMNEATSRA